MNKVNSHPRSFPVLAIVCIRIMRAILFLQLFVALVPALSVRSPSVVDDLKQLVSTSSSVAANLRARWTDHNDPNPAVIVNVTSEKDVAAVVSYCTTRKIPFLAQNGGNGWASTFNLGKNGVLINLAALNTVSVSKDRTEATIGGGVIIREAITAANSAGALIQTGNCNCVGALGAILGGGYGNLMGEIGFGIDNLISARVVIASGQIVTVSATSHPDLFFAIRGAGPNFGIVVSATVKAYPASVEERSAWLNTLFFTPEKLVDVAQAIQDLPLKPEQNVYLYLVNSGPPTNAPAIMVTGFLHKGTEESGRKAFAPLYNIGPVGNSSAVLPYTEWNTAGDGFCARGDRKPGHSTSIKSMQPSRWNEIWEIYTEFQKKSPNSAILIERYNLSKATTVKSETTALQKALRSEAFAQAIVLPWYTDKALDREAETFAEKVRSIWSFTRDPKRNPTYINFAHGDEELEAIYGEHLPRLRKLKSKWDPKGVFDQWFEIK
ncbi:FAD binding domain-containing protein [Dendryphion nanum]|uniref:FAD binding domain-containing protein n=1 Tax=Dendryphion nanum TaxID=256645 RepID=A0A9P9DQN9_9PLEO|nr:FAD binding domain-containing protein [Dendryphion nanum]